MTPPALASPPPAILALLDAQAVRYVVCGGLAALTCCLLVLARTRWGQSNPLRKCIVLSLVAHLLVGIYATTVQIVASGPPGGEATSIVLVDEAEAEATPAGEPLAQAPPEIEALTPNPLAETPAALASASNTPATPAAESPNVVPPRTDPPAHVENPSSETPAVGDAASQATPEPSSVEAAETAPAGEPPKPRSSAVATNNDIPPPDPVGAAAEKSPAVEPTPASEPPASRKDSLRAAVSAAPDATASAAKPTPEIYALRMARDHVRVAVQHGGSEETEAAVGSALRYLVANQSIDGRWNPRALEGGRQARVDGPDRQGVGLQADTGLTGLCLLSLLAAGHTHLQGEYSLSVRHGLEFLLGAQAADGNLCGAATTPERMYCHGMAAFALSEALAMTGDQRLQGAVRAAVGYTLRAQRPSEGGWRYQPGEPGDMSQFGWQAMALKSAQLAGIQIPEASQAAMRQFLQSVSSGEHAGRAAYRPGYQPSGAMTAEALVCRQFIGLEPDHPQSREAAEFLMRELPGKGQANVYFWYYGTLGMYQVQGEYWRRWNAALQKQLLTTQRRDGKFAGSWDPDPLWGGHGGRAFSTALSALCLEVYYRFLPLYAAHAETGGKTR